jgi:hypothetical protein
MAMYRLLFLFFVTLFVGCYTAKKATKDVIKAQTIFPKIVRNACANYYPGTDSVSRVIIYKPGRVDTVENFVEIDCGNYFIDSDFVHDTVPKIIKAKCPPSTNRIDTFFDRNYHTITDDAQTEIFRDSIINLQANTAVLLDDLTEYKANYKTALIWVGLLALLVLILFYLYGRKLFKH